MRPGILCEDVLSLEMNSILKIMFILEIFFAYFKAYGSPVNSFGCLFSLMKGSDSGASELESGWQSRALLVL